MQPLLSVILVNYNGEHFLEECFDSLFNSQTNFKFETLVLDNASQDQSLKKLRCYKDITLIENKVNVGFSRGNNICLKQAKGFYTLLLNTDTVLKQDSLQKMIDFMQNNPKVGALSPMLLNTDGSIQVQGSFLGSWRYYRKKACRISFICGACLLTKKDILDEIGGLDEHLFFYNDDIDFCKQLAKRKLPIYYFPDTQVIHHGGLSSKSRKADALLDGYKGSLYLCKKFYHPLIYVVYRLLMLVEASLKLAITQCLYCLKPKRFQEHKKAYVSIVTFLLKGVRL